MNEVKRVKLTRKGLKLHRQAQRRYYGKPDKRAAHIEREGRRRAFRMGVRVERVNLYEVFKSQLEGHTCLCAVCRCELKFIESSLDHIIPLAAGGDHVRDNIRLTHLTCNQGAENVRWLKRGVF